MGRGETEDILYGEVVLGRRAEISPATKDSSALEAAVIHKRYHYGTRFGDERISFNDWAEYHIQDWVVVFECLERMIVDGESKNDAPDDEVWELYTIIDEDLLKRQLKELLADDPALVEDSDIAGFGLKAYLGI